jgi:tetratricopeptide (TPR) repeat protein
MNTWRIAGLIVLALLAGSLLMWWLFPTKPPPPEPPPPPAREVFDTSKPLRLEVVPADGNSESSAWLAYELRQMLNRAKLQLTPVTSDESTFTLRVTVSGDAKQASLALIAPDKVVERQEDLALTSDSKLTTITELAKALPPFLGALESSSNWAPLIGTDDARAYEQYVTSMMDVLGPTATGCTRPRAIANPSRAVERLESLSRAQPRFTRARAALAVGYLSLGGQDDASLAELAQATAERALAQDEIAEARAALGLVHLRKSEWVSAREQFDRALALDDSSVPALEGSGCLLIDAGQFDAARDSLRQAVALQPANVSAEECLAYADMKSDAAPAAEEAPAKGDPTAGVHALAALLAKDHDSARRLLEGSLSEQDFREWGDPLLHAARDRGRIPEALQAITRAANEGRIDPTTEILSGAALRQAEFVFNRMARLQRHREPVPLRLLWLPQTDFLRRHSRFEQIVSTAGLPAFWQEHGAPDACASEPNIYGCKLRTAPPAAKKTSTSASNQP